MSSGAVVGTISTTICEPLRCSKAASLVSRPERCAASSVPVWSITRAVSVGIGSGPCASAGRPAHARAAMKIAASARRIRAAAIGAASYFLGVLKSTVGGVEIWASFCTEKFAFGL